MERSYEPVAGWYEWRIRDGVKHRVCYHIAPVGDDCFDILKKFPSND